MRRSSLLLLLPALVLFLFAPAARAGVTGKITGQVFDKETGEVMQYVNVIVEDTHLGAMTDEKGKFFILNVPPGSYDVRAESMGYTAQRQLGVKVFSDRNTPVKFELLPTVIESEDFQTEVVATRALIQRDVTSSMRTVSAESIEQMPINNVNELLQTTAGVVSQGGELHFRGGRGNEARYLVDGISVKDPITGEGSGLNVGRAAIEEITVLQGGFDAEYGEAQSAIIKVVTKEGTPEWGGSLRYKSDNLSPEAYSLNSDYAEFSLQGPEPISSYLFPALGLELPGDQLTWFFTATGDVRDTHTPFANKPAETNNLLGFDFDNRYRNDLSLTSKWVWKIGTADKLTFSVKNSWEQRDYYQHSFTLVPEHAYWQTERSTSLAYVTWNHTISPQTFFELRASRVQTQTIQDAGALPNEFPLEPDLGDPTTVPWAEGEYYEWFAKYINADDSEPFEDGDLLVDASEIWDDFGEDRLPNTFDRGEGDGVPNDWPDDSPVKRETGRGGYVDVGFDGVESTGDYGEGDGSFNTYNSLPEFLIFVPDYYDLNHNARYEIAERDAGMGEWFVDRNGNGYYDAPNGLHDDGEAYLDMDGNSHRNSNDGFYDGARPEEFYTDANNNALYDPPETYVDANSNGRFDAGEPFYDYGLDQLPNTNDWGEGNGVFDVHPSDPSVHEYYVDLNENGNFDGGESFTDGESFAEDTFLDSNNDGRFNDYDESYTDANGNGRWDIGEDFQDWSNGIFDEGEPFSDVGLDGIPRTGDTGEADGHWGEGEPFYDSNGNDQYDAFTGARYIDANLNGQWDWDDTNGDGRFQTSDAFELFYSDILIDFGVDGQPNTHDVGEGNGSYDTGEPFFDVIGDGEWDRGDTFVDRTGNDQYDGGEPFSDTGPDGTYATYDPGQWNGVYDVGEPYEDLDGDGSYTYAIAGNGRWDVGEPYQDRDGDGEYDAPNGRWDRGEPFVDANFNGVWDEEYIGAFRQHSPYERTESIQYTVLASLESQASEHHMVKAGAEFRQHFLEQQRISYPYYRFVAAEGSVEATGRWTERGIFRNFWDAPPLEGAVWLQDQYEWEDLIIKSGLRYDFWVVRGIFGDGGTVPDTLRKTLENKVSPRLGVSYPVSERDKMYFSYGHFSQVPELSSIYNSNEQGASALALKGNYELKSPKTVAYEFGIDHAFSDDVKVDIKAFFKDFRDLIQASRTVNEATGRPEWVYQNSDYGSARGLEVVLDKRYSDYTSGNLSYTFQFATGKNSDSFDGYGASATTPREFPLDFDQRHSLSLNIDFRVMADQHPAVAGFKLPDRWGVNLLWQVGSGFPYTPELFGREIGAKNSARLPWTGNVDVIVDKSFDLASLRYNVFAEVSNLFDRENVQYVDPEYRTWYGDNQPINRNPARLLPGRQIEVGFEIGF